jgi:hypothetical protein
MSQKMILTFIVASIFGLVSLVSLAAAGEKPKTDSSKTQVPAGQPVASNVNNITQTAFKAGAVACAGRINQVANFLTVGSKGAGALMFLPPNNADQQLISVSMEIPSNDASVYASASFSPSQVTGCTGMYETVAYWTQKCAEVAEKQFGEFKKAGALSKNILIRDGGESIKIFLMPAGTGCISIKKEVVR